MASTRIKIVEIVRIDEAKNRHIDILKLEEKLGLGNSIMAFKSPKVLLIKEEETKGILIDEPKNILDIKLDLIHPLPPIIEKINQESSIWGTCFLDENALFLMDCYKLLETESVADKPELGQHALS